MATLAQALRSIVQVPRVESSTPVDGVITREVVERVFANGKHVVRGVEVPVSGLAAFVAGNVVPVVWKDGRPALILGHRWRRAQFHPSFRISTQGIVEELFVAAIGAGAKPDVWYRNGVLAKLLSVVSQLGGHVPSVVKWGYDGKSFALMCTDGFYAIFTLDRDPNVLIDDAPGAEPVLVWLGKPLESNVTLCAMTAISSHEHTNKYIYGERITKASYVRRDAWPYGWHYYEVWDVAQQWDGGESFTGQARVSATKTFPLKDMLAGGVQDNYGAFARAEVLDWCLDGQGRLLFTIRATWDWFRVGTSGTATGTVGARTGSVVKPSDCPEWQKWKIVQQEIGVSSQAIATIGAKKRSDLSTVPEEHVFLYDGRAGSVVWATAASSSTYMAENKTVDVSLLEHSVFTSPGHGPDYFGNTQEPVDSESYYGGAFWSNNPVTMMTKSDNAGDVGLVLSSSNGTFQMFNPGGCPWMSGPYMAESRGSWTYWRTILGSWTVQWKVDVTEQYVTYQHLWHYRVAAAFPFQANLETYVFLVVERYPYISGTGYINDLPQIGVFVVRTTGAVVATLRPFQYGLNADGTALITGNAHRLLWSLGVGAIQPKPAYYHTNLDTAQETVLSPGQLEQYLTEGRPTLFAPDFLWSRAAPERFFTVASLPEIVRDDVLGEYATLHPVEGAPQGSVRIVNDEETLNPLERYQAS